jgi:TRAP-type C4-dicarboxylate transport system permease small subunit
VGTASGDDPPDPGTAPPTDDAPKPAAAVEPAAAAPPVVDETVDDPVVVRPAAAALMADVPIPETPAQIAHAEHGHRHHGGSMFARLDGEPAMAHKLRVVDEMMGMVERVYLFAAFSLLVLLGLYRTFVDFAWGERPLWAIELVRLSAFSIGMWGAVYATQNRRNFGLDLVSALFPTKLKAVIRVFTNLATLAAAGLLFYGGRLIQEALTKEKQHYELIPITMVGWLIPICALLIGFHVLMHTVIEIDYLRSGKTAPEPEVVG